MRSMFIWHRLSDRDCPNAERQRDIVRVMEHEDREAVQREECGSVFAFDDERGWLDEGYRGRSKGRRLSWEGEI